MRTGGLVADFGLVMTFLLESQRAPRRPRSTNGIVGADARERIEIIEQLYYKTTTNHVKQLIIH